MSGAEIFGVAFLGGFVGGGLACFFAYAWLMWGED